MSQLIPFLSEVFFQNKLVITNAHFQPMELLLTNTIIILIKVV